MDYVLIFCLAMTVVLLMMLLWVVLDIRRITLNQRRLASQVKINIKHLIECLDRFHSIAIQLSNTRKQ